LAPCERLYRRSRTLDAPMLRDPSDLDRGTIVVLPSATFAISELRKIIAIQHYEERLLCTLLRLADRRQRIVYLTSLPLDEAVIGSKTGSRRVAGRAGVAVLEGEEDLRSVAEVEAAIERLRDRRPGRAAVIKLNDGFSGQGNAFVELDGFHSLDEAPIAFCAV